MPRCISLVGIRQLFAAVFFLKLLLSLPFSSDAAYASTFLRRNRSQATWGAASHRAYLTERMRASTIEQIHHGQRIVLAAKKVARIPPGGGSLGQPPSNTVNVGLLPLLANLTNWVTSSRLRCWIVLIAAILMDIYATAVTKIASDTKSPGRMLWALCTYLFSQVLFAGCLAKIEVAVAYAVWSAMGTAFVTATAIAFFGEKCSPTKAVCLFLIVVGVVGLNLLEK